MSDSSRLSVPSWLYRDTYSLAGYLLFAVMTVLGWRGYVRKHEAIYLLGSRRVGRLRAQLRLAEVLAAVAKEGRKHLDPKRPAQGRYFTEEEEFDAAIDLTGLGGIVSHDGARVREPHRPEPFGRQAGHLDEVANHTRRLWTNSVCSVVRTNNPKPFNAHVPNRAAHFFPSVHFRTVVLSDMIKKAEPVKKPLVSDVHFLAIDNTGDPLTVYYSMLLQYHSFTTL